MFKVFSGNNEAELIAKQREEAAVKIQVNYIYFLLFYSKRLN